MNTIYPLNATQGDAPLNDEYAQANQETTHKPFVKSQRNDIELEKYPSNQKKIATLPQNNPKTITPTFANN